MKYATIILVGLMLVGCWEVEPEVHDQCMRREIFKECLAALPAGPKQTQYNDWAEVVRECETAAYYQSYRTKRFVSEECRW